MSVKGCCESHDQPGKNIKPVSTTINKIAIALTVIAIIGLAFAAFGASRLIMGDVGVFSPVGVFSRIDQLAAILMIGIGGGTALLSFVVITVLKIVEHCQAVKAKKAAAPPLVPPTAPPTSTTATTVVIPVVTTTPTNPTTGPVHPTPSPFPSSPYKPPIIPPTVNPQTVTATPPSSIPLPTIPFPTLPPPVAIVSSIHAYTHIPVPTGVTPPFAATISPVLPLPTTVPPTLTAPTSTRTTTVPATTTTPTLPPPSGKPVSFSTLTFGAPSGPAPVPLMSLMPTAPAPGATTATTAPSAPAKKALTLKTNLPGELMFSQTKFDLKPAEAQQIKAIRQKMMQYLAIYFELDEYGYIQGVKDENKLKEITQNEDKVAALFYEVANLGDAGYAESIRTTLLGLGVGASQVDKSNRNNKIKDPNRPVSFVKESTRNGQNEPANHGKKSQPAYLDLWEQSIWSGYKDHRYKTYPKKGVFASKIKDTEFTAAQKADYQRRLQRVDDLHKQGWLIGRVAELAEVQAFAGHRYRMQNDILSTTLWPPKGANITLKLYSESGEAPVGILIDASRAGHEDFALGFHKNAFTVGTGYKNLKKAGKSGGFDGVETLKGQHDLYETLNGMAAQGASVSSIEPTVSADKKSYQVPKANARGVTAAPTGRGGAPTPGQSKNQLSHNEQTFYRGAERDIFLGFFVKSDSDDMPGALRNIILQQDRIRRTKGVYIPIFQFKGDSNQLEEIVPDALIIQLLGLEGQVEAHPDAKSRLSTALSDAGITGDIAKAASLAVKDKKFSDIFRALFDMQFLMYNMKNIGGSLSVLEKQGHGAHVQHVYKQIRILDNLHLVFPTIHKTKNTASERQEHCLTKGDLQNLQSDPKLFQFFQLSIRNNLKRFLGIERELVSGKMTFDKKVLGMFDRNDPKRTDFAQVLSRAMQAAVLFNVFGPADVHNIVASVRNELPYLGITPATVDMILGSRDMQEITTLKNLKPFYINPPYRSQQWLAGQPTPFPPRPPSFKGLESINIFDSPNTIITAIQPVANDVGNYLLALGIQVLDQAGNAKIDPAKIDSFRSADDEHLIKYETEVMQVIAIATMLNPPASGNILKAVRATYPAFGYSAAGREAHNSQDKRLKWIEQKLHGHSPSTEFPFKEHKAAQVETGEGDDLVFQDKDGNPTRTPFSRRLGKFVEPVVTRGRAVMPAAVASAPENQLLTQNREQLKTHLSARLASLVPAYDPNGQQAKVAKQLGLINANGERLWEVTPQFHNMDRGKPVAPYLEPEDMMGENAVELLTGPAFEEKTLRADQATFQCDVDMDVLARYYEDGTDPAAIQTRMLTHTLAVTVDGDAQVLRPNGWHYSKVGAEPPMGGNIEFNQRNERFHFRDDTERKFLKPGYSGMGGYTQPQLDEVKAYDDQLLSDEERRLKRAGMLSSAYITVTAKGAGEERIPLDRGYKVLLVNAAGPQFEKYDSPTYKNAKGKNKSSELEATDFVIKPGAKRKEEPLFPEYYPGGQIPAHSEIPQPQVASIGFEFDKPYVRLTDGALFNRAAHQVASDKYLAWVVGKTIVRTKGPAYMKATLFGGGFFADTKKAGNLRQEVIYSMVTSWKNLLKNGSLPKGSVIEFPRYGARDSLPKTLVDELRHYAKQSGVSIVWSEKGDMHDFGPQKDLEGNVVNPAEFEKNGALVIFNAADMFSWTGDEKSSASVDSINANNSNMRLVMNWWANPHVLNAPSGTGAKMSPPSGVSVQPANRKLINLQQKNPLNPIYQQPYQHIRGPAESTIAFPGYDTPKLQQIEQHLVTHEIPLRVCPKRPDQSYPMDQAKAAKYVGSLDPQDQPLAQKALDHTQHITMAKFDGALKQCVGELNKRINTPYSVGMVCGKSMQWVASLALKDVTTLPASWFPLSSKQGSWTAKTPESHLDISHVTEDTLVIFDDCSYSGTQLFDNLCKIEEAVNKGKVPKKLYMVIPFVSQAALDFYKHFQTTMHRSAPSLLQVELITGNEKIHCVRDIFPDPNERKQVSNFFEAQYLSTAHAHLNLPGTTSLCWADWRMPDGQSFEAGFGSTHMRKRNLAGFYLDRLPQAEYFIPEQIPRPYNIT